jgi:hypothetical protein
MEVHPLLAEYDRTSVATLQPANPARAARGRAVRILLPRRFADDDARVEEEESELRRGGESGELSCRGGVEE